MDTIKQISRRCPPSSAGLLVFGALLGCAGCTSVDPNVFTQHNDNLRTGAYLAERSDQNPQTGVRKAQPAAGAILGVRHCGRLRDKDVPLSRFDLQRTRFLMTIVS